MKKAIEERRAYRSLELVEIDEGIVEEPVKAAPRCRFAQRTLSEISHSPDVPVHIPGEINLDYSLIFDK